MTTCQICNFDYAECRTHCPVCGTWEYMGRAPFVIVDMPPPRNVRKIVVAKGAESVIPHSYPLHVYAVQRRSAAAE